MSEQKTIEITKTILEKLAYAKFLYDQGLSNSTKPYPFSTIAILNYHDAIEFFLAVVMDAYNVPKSQGINDCISRLKQKNISISDDVGVNKISNIRNNLKHGALIPSAIQLKDSTLHTTAFLNDNCKALLDLDFEQISTAQLINDEEIKTHLLSAADKFKANDIDNTRFELAFAFGKTVDKYKDKSKGVYPMPFYFGNKHSFRSAFFMGLDRANGRPSDYQRLNDEFAEINSKFTKIGEFIDSAKESIEAMQDAVEMLSLGIDYKKFVIFSQMIPRTSRTLGGEHHVDIGGRMAASPFLEKDLQFCIEFIVECYFLLND